MKKILRISATVLAVLQIGALCACKKDTDTTSSSSDSYTQTVISSNDSVSSDSQSTQASSSQAQPSSVPSSSAPVNSNPGGKTSLSRDQVINNMPSMLKNTRIKYYSWVNPKNLIEKEAFEAFEKATGITVDVEVINLNEWALQLAARINSGKSPDVVRIIDNSPENIKLLQPISNTGFNFNDSAWDSALMKFYTFNNRTYAMNLQGGGALSDVAIIYYNKAALRRAEMEDPYKLWKSNPGAWTWDKLWNMCSVFLQRNNNKEGYYGISFAYENGYQRAFGALNYNYDVKTGKWVNYMKDPELVKRWEILTDAYSKNWAAKTNSQDTFAMGKSLFYWGNTYDARRRNTVFLDLKQKGNLGTVPIPTDSKYMTIYEPTAFGVPVGAKNKEAVPYLIRYVLDAKSYNVNKIYFDDQATDVVKSSQARGNFFYGSNAEWAVTNELNAATSSQVKSILDKYYGVIDDKVNRYNSEMKSFPN